MKARNIGAQLRSAYDQVVIEMGIDWPSHHLKVLKIIRDTPHSFDDIQEQTCLRGGDIASIIGGLMVKRCIYGTKGRIGVFEITSIGKRYLDYLDNGDK